ncbi:MAG: hypothetical protein KF767_15005 [Bdellovibrionaceae bacterium]|nr:hypothetical protein [Pseudobdellovibrionaceae bacterium]
MTDFVRELERVYPATVKSLRRADQEDLIHQFENFLMEDLSGVSEPARWLPLFLKTRAVPGKILQASEWEWAHFVCQIVDYGRRPLDPGQIHINPSMQFIELHESVPDLRRDSGLYGIFVFGNRVHSRQFALGEALLLETLHEDRKFSRSQLIEAARIEAQSWPQLQAVDWDSLLNEMTVAGVLTESPPATTP